MNISMEALPGMVDVTQVTAQARLQDIEFICKIAKAYGCAATMVNPCYLTYTIKNTIGYDEIAKGAAICFPLGCDLTSVKVYSAKQSEIMGAQEIDMMMNVGAFLSGNMKYVRQDIEAVCDSVKVPVKVVLETSLLTDAEIGIAAEQVAKTKASYIKTNTGFYSKPTTPEIIRIIKNAVGDDIKIKASGGIRTIEDMMKMAELGVDRFGISGIYALDIFRQIDKELGREAPEI
ncbi:deoxyribose-phosphate aldolase [Christensenellaceae bacterium OttesenSCG-928-K19]|nr:deoxyribose-phosphate aldolase [Christensenellaceae bacterium OttesenSCG-928-K19]